MHDDLPARLRTLYEDYISGAEAHFQNAKASLANLMSGRGRYNDCPLDESFLQSVGELVKEAAEAPADSGAAAALLELMLFQSYVKREHPAYWVLVAAEGLAWPLPKLLDRPALEDIYARYRKKLRAAGAFPRQKDVLKEMKAALKT